MIELMRSLLVLMTILLAVGAQPNEADTKLNQYLTMIQQKVSQIAPKSREKYSVTVVVDIESSGHLSALRVTKSSGDPRVDESVLRAVLAKVVRLTLCRRRWLPDSPVWRSKFNTNRCAK